jgi:hypothetical protein
LVALEDALPPEDGTADCPLYQAALAVEQDQALMAERAEWEVATLEDGLLDDGRRCWPEIASFAPRDDKGCPCERSEAISET